MTLFPIYGNPTEKLIARNTYTHAGAEQQCARYNLTLAKRDQPSVGYNDNCIKMFGRKILNLSPIREQFIWLSECPIDGCKFMLSSQPNSTTILHATNRQHKTSSTLALCQGKDSPGAYLQFCFSVSLLTWFITVSAQSMATGRFTESSPANHGTYS